MSHATASQTAQPPPAAKYTGAFSLFKPSKEAVMRAFSSLALIVAFSFAVSIGINLVVSIFFGAPALTNEADLSSLDTSKYGFTLASNVSSLANTVLSTFTSAMFALVILASIRGKIIQFGEAIQYARKNFVRFLLAHILVSLAVLGGFLLLIIPGIIIAIRLSLIDYVLVDNEKLDGMEAFKYTWHLTAGHSGKVWGIFGVVLLMCLPILTIIGVFATIVLLILYSAAMPLLYIHLTGKHNVLPAPPPASAVPKAKISQA